jgi:predicted alpha/beta hydrolase family esterase
MAAVSTVAFLFMVAVNDPHCSMERAATWAAYWGSRFVGVGSKGHINAQSDIHNWEEGLSVLRQLENMVVNKNTYAEIAL